MLQDKKSCENSCKKYLLMILQDQYFKHHPQFMDFPCTYLHTYIITLKYVQTYLLTCKVPYTVSTCLARQGLWDDTMESREKSGTPLARSRSETGTNTFGNLVWGNGTENMARRVSSWQLLWTNNLTKLTYTYSFVFSQNRNEKR